MAETVAVLTARLEADTARFNKGMKSAERRLDSLESETKKAGKATDNMTSKMSKSGAIMKTVFAGAAAAAVVKFGADTVKSAVNLNEALNASEVVFGEYSDGIKELGKDSAQAFGLSESAFLQFATRFSAFAENIAGDSRSVVDVTEELTGRVADFASVHNLEVENAAQVVQSALAGETEAFRRFGGDVSAAAVQTKAFALGLGDASGKLTEQEKILARYELIMEQTADTAGDFKNTQDDLANATRTLAAEWEDAKAALGQALIPTLTSLIPAGKKAVEEVVELANEFAELTGAVSPAQASLNKFEIQQGRSAQTGAALHAVMVDLKDRTTDWQETLRDTGLNAQIARDHNENLTANYKDLVGIIDLTAEEMRLLIDGEYKDLFLANDVLADEYEVLIALLRDEYHKTLQETVVHTQDVRDAVLDGLDPALADLIIRLGGTEDAFVFAAEDAEKFGDTMFAIVDPFQRTIKAGEDLDEALAIWKENVQKYGAHSEEAAIALLAVFEAQGNLSEAQDAITQDMIDAAVAHAENLGADAEQAAVLREELEKLANGDYGFMIGGDLTPGARAALDAVRALEGLGPAPSSSSNSPSPVIPTTPLPLAHAGGIVPGPRGADVPIIAQAGEQIIPANQANQAPLGDMVFNVAGDLDAAAAEEIQDTILNEVVALWAETTRI